MKEVTSKDRENELRQLIDKVSSQPNRSWSDERKRIAVLQTQLASEHAAA